MLPVLFVFQISLGKEGFNGGKGLQFLWGEVTLGFRPEETDGSDEVFLFIKEDTALIG